MMTRWLSTLFLILALSSGIFAGVPLQSGDQQECSMDCCHKALSRENTPEVTAAKLCCGVVCRQSGSTSSTVKMPQFTPLAVFVIFFTTLKKPLVGDTKTPPQKSISKTSHQNSHPLYIRHHALLI